VVAEVTWRDKAACKDIPVAIHDRHFFPGTSGRPAPERAYDYARHTYCHVCPVIDRCLQTALKNKEQFGLWGGLSPAQRRVLADSDFQHGTLTGYRQHYEVFEKPCDDCNTRRHNHDQGKKAS
jgi:WhiB family redox-sensing transcriptional regulator